MSDRRSSGVHLVPAAVAPLLLVGIAFGAEAGWLANLVALVLAGAALRRVQPGLARARERGLPGLGVLPGLGITLMGLVTAIVLLAALAVAVGDVLVAHPGAVWAAPVLLLGVLVRGTLQGRARALATWAFALGLPVAGWLGDGLEAEGAAAHGYAHSGPIAGVHPFQMTAVIIDGYGPFDISVNDYVEPDGSRGYGPELAQMLERTLHALADIHFPDGPARARKAFGEATVELGEIPQLYDEIHNPLSIGLRVASGTHGERSRVEFVCPGRVVDPRARRPDTVMRDTCPDKYAAEGSAGLGLTGRWAGYTEGRGNARQSLAHVAGATRTDDARGGRVRHLERMAFVALLLGLGLVLARREGKDALEGVAGIGGAAAVAALSIGFVLLVAFVREPLVPAVGSPDALGWGGASVLAGISGLAGLVWLDPDRRDDGSIWVAATVGLLAIGSAWSLVSPSSAVALARAVAPTGLVELLADRASLLTGLDVQGLEGAFAALGVGILAAATLTVVEPLAQASVRLGLDIEGRPRWPVVLVVLGAGALAWSEPLGRAWLVLGVGACALMASAVSVASRRIDGARVLVDLVVHLGIAVVVVWSLFVTLQVGEAAGGAFLAIALAVSFAIGSLGIGLSKPAAPE